MTRSTSRRPSKPLSSSSSPRKRNAESALLHRGFKAGAERQATEVRQKLELTDRDPLNPFNLADHLRIKVHPLSQLQDFGLTRDALDHLLRLRPGVCSGFYICAPGCMPHIFYNDSHADTRRASDITHECSHDILGHEPTEVFDGLGCRRWNAVQEAEVNYFAPALLVPREGVLWALRSGMTYDAAAAHFQVSEILFRMRANLTGAAAQLARARQRWRGRSS